MPADKLYGSESQPITEPVENLKKVAWNLGEDRFRLLYAAQVNGLMGKIGAQKTEGNRLVERTLSWIELRKTLAGMTSSKYFAVDFEPGKPDEGWMWDYDSPNFKHAMYRLSETMNKKHKKFFYSWIGSNTSFDYDGKTVKLGWIRHRPVEKRPLTARRSKIGSRFTKRPSRSVMSNRPVAD